MEDRMIKKLKLSALALLTGAAAMPAHAETNLLQTVSVALTAYAQGTPSATQNFINQFAFSTKTLIKAISASGTFNTGDLLVRVTPVTNVVVDVTNLTQISTTNLVITNTSSTNLNYNLTFGGVTTNIGDTNVTFGADVVDIGGGTNVTLGTNTASIGTNLPALIIGTNTTVTVTTVTNGAGEIIGTNYAFAINALSTVATATNTLGTASWAIYNKKTSPSLTPISTNVLFDIHRDEVYGDGTNLAYVHGEKIKANGEIEFGTTEEIRTLILSNSIGQVKLEGYAHGRVVPVSLGKTAAAPVVYSQNYNWTGSGSGITNDAIVIINGTISESFLGLHD
jgi:hypothetical protein